MKINIIHNMDWIDGLNELPDKSVDMCITSPPYWGLRDYGVDGQLGLESHFDEYINKLCSGFDEVKRVLKDGGTCWVNISDTYSSNIKGDSRGPGEHFKKSGLNNGAGVNPHEKVHSQGFKPYKVETGIKNKSLVGIPFRFALEMINRGWILRNTIIWHKPNCMPSSVKDRFTVDFEYLFFFSKNKKYYFEQQFEPHKREWWKEEYENSLKKPELKSNSLRNQHGGNKKFSESVNMKGRNMRAVWKITTKPYKGAHFAVFPRELIETPIKAGCPVNGIVLDPFMGSGTTAEVAKSLGRNYIGFELNPEYIELINERVSKVEKPLTSFGGK